MKNKTKRKSESKESFFFATSLSMLTRRGTCARARVYVHHICLHLRVRVMRCAVYALCNSIQRNAHQFVFFGLKMSHVLQIYHFCYTEKQALNLLYTIYQYDMRFLSLSPCVIYMNFLFFVVFCFVLLVEPLLSCITQREQSQFNSTAQFVRWNGQIRIHFSSLISKFMSELFVFRRGR